MNSSKDKYNTLTKLIINNTNNYSALIIGCKATELSYDCCEYNILKIGNYKNSEIINDKNMGFIHINYITYEKFLELRNIDSYFLLNNIIIHDNMLRLSTKLNDVIEQRTSIINRYNKSIYIDLTNEIEKANNAIDKSYYQDAGFWILSASYNLIKLIIAQSNTIISPSHLLDQLKYKNHEFNIDDCYSLLNLEITTKSSVERRLKSLNNLYVILLNRSDNEQEYIIKRIELLKNKINWLLKNKMITNAFVLLGYENILLIKKIYNEYCNSKQITPHNYKIINEIINDKDNPYKVSKSTINMLSISNEEHEITLKQNILNKLTNKIKNNIKY